MSTSSNTNTTGDGSGGDDCAGTSPSQTQVSQFRLNCRLNEPNSLPCQDAAVVGQA